MLAAGLTALTLTSVVSACGGGESEGAAEPSGSFRVEVAKAGFPERQRLVQASDLQLEVRNIDDQTIPNLAVTIYTGDTKAGGTATGSGQGSFNTPVDQPGLANRNRAVWILENQYPKVLPPGVENPGEAPSAGAAAAQTDTFQFGPMRAGDSKDIVWRVTPVRAGTYTVHYEVAAGLEGKAKAVTAQGRPVKGDFAVTINRKPQQTCVNDAGKITTNCRS